MEVYKDFKDFLDNLYLNEKASKETKEQILKQRRDKEAMREYDRQLQMKQPKMSDHSQKKGAKDDDQPPSLEEELNIP